MNDLKPGIVVLLCIGSLLLGILLLFFLTPAPNHYKEFYSIENQCRLMAEQRVSCYKGCQLSNAIGFDRYWECSGLCDALYHVTVNNVDSLGSPEPCSYNEGAFDAAEQLREHQPLLPVPSAEIPKADQNTIDCTQNQEGLIDQIQAYCKDFCTTPKTWLPHFTPYMGGVAGGFKFINEKQRILGISLNSCLCINTGEGYDYNATIYDISEPKKFYCGDQK